MGDIKTYVLKKELHEPAGKGSVFISTKKHEYSGLNGKKSGGSKNVGMQPKILKK